MKKEKKNIDEKAKCLAKYLIRFIRDSEQRNAFSCKPKQLQFTRLLSCGLNVLGMHLDDLAAFLPTNFIAIINVTIIVLDRRTRLHCYACFCVVWDLDIAPLWMLETLFVDCFHVLQNNGHVFIRKDFSCLSRNFSPSIMKFWNLNFMYNCLLKLVTSFVFSFRNPQSDFQNDSFTNHFEFMQFFIRNRFTIEYNERSKCQNIFWTDRSKLHYSSIATKMYSYVEFGLNKQWKKNDMMTKIVWKNVHSVAEIHRACS